MRLVELLGKGHHHADRYSPEAEVKIVLRVGTDDTGLSGRLAVGDSGPDFTLFVENENGARYRHDDHPQG